MSFFRADVGEAENYKSIGFNDSGRHGRGGGIIFSRTSDVSSSLGHGGGCIFCYGSQRSKT